VGTTLKNFFNNILFFLVLSGYPFVAILKYRPEKKFSKSIFVLYAGALTLFLIALAEGRMDAKSFFAWCALLLIPSLPLSRYKLNTRYNLTGLDSKVVLFLAAIILVCVFFRNDHLIIGIDKNIFTVALVAPFLILIRLGNFGIFGGALLLASALATGSTNFVIFSLTLLIGRYFFKPEASVAALISGTSIAFVLSSAVVTYSAINFDFHVPMSLLEVPSVIQRGWAFREAVGFIESNNLIFNGSYASYRDSVDTVVHNDYVQVLIRYGFLYLSAFIILTSWGFKRLGLSCSETFAVVFFSSNLGLIGWLGGAFFFLHFIIAFEFILPRQDKRVLNGAS
jgi:hypothetical protein